MKLIGALLVLWGASAGYLLHRRQRLRPLRVGQALLGDLAVLRHQICVRRTPLPVILERDLADGTGAEVFWRPLGELLADPCGENALPNCWTLAAAGLPAPLEEMLAPLGPLLPVGGAELERAVNETREELAGFLRSERERQAAAGRLSAALCLSGASLLILVLI